MAKAHRPVRCTACEHEGLWHHHGHRSHRCQRGAEVLCLVVYRFRCPRCRATATALPDELLPGIDLDLDVKARSDDKRRALQDGWQAIRAVRLLAEQLGVALFQSRRL